MGGRFIDMQIHRAAMLIGKLQQSAQGPARRSTSTWRSKNTADHALGMGHLSRQVFTLWRRPVLHWHQRNKLQLDALTPPSSQSRQHLPAAVRTRPEAVDVTAHSPQAMVPSQLQSTFRTLLNPLGRAGLVFPEVGRQGS
ncbi:MAG: Uncharacterised protein [Synechococcus sp. MIT S9220]|nr:MAG: Uncharacterised protein [Synechococcus sp. MIT S9220]